MDGTPQDRDAQGQDLRTHPEPPEQDAPAAGDVFNLIADVEQRLGHLRKLQTESQSARDRMREREEALNRRDEELRAQSEALRADREALEAQRAALQASQADLERARSQFDERQAAAAAELSDRASQLEARAAELDHRERQIAESAAALAKEREALDAMAAELTAREGALVSQMNEAQAKFDAERAALTTAAAEAERTASEKAEEARRAAETLVELTKQSERLADEAACWRRTAEELETQSAAAAEELRAQLREATEARDTVRAELQTAVAERDAAKAEIQSLASERDAAKAELQGSASERDALRDQIKQITEASGAAASRIADLERTVAERDEKVADLTRKLSAATAKLREVCRALEHQGEAVQQIQAAGDELRRKDQTIAELQATIAELNSRLAEAEASGPAPDRETAEVRRRLELAEAELGRLSAKLREARAEADALREEAAAATQEAQPGRGVQGDTRYSDELIESLERRHRRLQAVRAHLRDQARKVKQAGALLGERRAQVEKVLAQRAELAAARNVMAESQRKLERMQKRAAKVRVFAVLFYGAALLGVLGALSWALTTQLAPATYAARVTLRAESGGRPVTDAQLEEWQRFHESLVMDPQLLQAVAERMQRRGIMTLATPGLLLERLSRDMDHQSARPGELTIELRGKGDSRTVRELDTYVTALVSHATSTVGRRADGVATFIAEPANATGPIDDQRLVYCAVFFGGGVVASAICGVFIWRRLAAAKVRFEEEANIDAILDETNWAEPARA